MVGCIISNSAFAYISDGNCMYLPGENGNKYCYKQGTMTFITESTDSSRNDEIPVDITGAGDLYWGPNHHHHAICAVYGANGWRLTKTQREANTANGIQKIYQCGR